MPALRLVLPPKPPRPKKRSGLTFALLLVAGFAAFVVMLGKNVPDDRGDPSSTAKTAPQASGSGGSDAADAGTPDQSATDKTSDRAAPPQAHPPKACNGDQRCLLAWYNEYKPAILDEFLFWRAFEDAVAAENSNGALMAYNYASREKQYKHLYWAFYAGPSIKGVSPKALSALVDGCRNAIIDMKYMLLPVMDGKPTEGAHDYLERARKCERQFNPPEFRSQLRGNARD